MNLFESRGITYTAAFRDLLLDVLSAAPMAALVANATVRLLKEPPPSLFPDSLDAVFTGAEADYDDYLATAITFGANTNLGGYLRGKTGLVTFDVTTAVMTTANSIVGYWIDSDAGFVGYELFQDSEVTPMAVAGDQLVISTYLPIDVYTSVELQT